MATSKSLLIPSDSTTPLLRLGAGGMLSRLGAGGMLSHLGAGLLLAMGMGSASLSSEAAEVSCDALYKSVMAGAQYSISVDVASGSVLVKSGGNSCNDPIDSWSKRTLPMPPTLDQPAAKPAAKSVAGSAPARPPVARQDDDNATMIVDIPMRKKSLTERLTAPMGDTGGSTVIRPRFAEPNAPVPTEVPARVRASALPAAPATPDGQDASSHTGTAAAAAKGGVKGSTAAAPVDQITGEIGSAGVGSEFSPHDGASSDGASSDGMPVAAGEAGTGTTQGPPPKPGADAEACSRKIRDYWKPGNYRIKKELFRLSSIYTMDSDKDGITDNLGFKLYSAAGSSSIIRYFSSTGNLAVQNIPSLRLPNDSDIFKICAGRLDFVVKEKDAPVDKKGKKKAEKKDKKKAAPKRKGPTPEPEQGPLKLDVVPDEKFTVDEETLEDVNSQLGLIGIIMLAISATGFYFLMRSRRKKNDEDDDDYDDDDYEDDDDYDDDDFVEYDDGK